jgi:hypothetical protein
VEICNLLGEAPLHGIHIFEDVNLCPEYGGNMLLRNVSIDLPRLHGITTQRPQYKFPNLAYRVYHLTQHTATAARIPGGYAKTSYGIFKIEKYNFMINTLF